MAKFIKVSAIYEGVGVETFDLYIDVNQVESFRENDDPSRKILLCTSSVRNAFLNMTKDDLINTIISAKDSTIDMIDLTCRINKQGDAYTYTFLVENIVGFFFDKVSGYTRVVATIPEGSAFSELSPEEIYDKIYA